MKDAAEDYFTTDRMPTELGKEETLTRIRKAIKAL